MSSINKVLEASVAFDLDRIKMAIDAHVSCTMLVLVNGSTCTKFKSQVGALIADLDVYTTTIIGVDSGKKFEGSSSSHGLFNF